LLRGTCVVAVSLLLEPVEAQVVPDGPELQINTTTAAFQSGVTLSHDDGGGFVAAWQDYGQDGGGYGLFGQRFDSAGSKLGGEFQINSHTAAIYQRYAAVSHDPSCSFVVVWDSRAQDGSGEGVFGQRFDSAGGKLGLEFQVNMTTAGYQRIPALDHDSSGNFVVVWEDGGGLDGSSYGVFAQRFDSSGVKLGVEFQVNTYTTSYQRSASVSYDSSGQFVVVWESDGQDGDLNGIFGQRFDAGGGKLGVEFQVHSFTSNRQRDPAISHATSGGGLVVLWTGYGQDGDVSGVFGQRFDGSGNKVGGDFQVNLYTAGTQWQPVVSHDPSGEFIAGWTSDEQDLSGHGIFGRRFDSAGAARGGEFQINTTTIGFQTAPQLSHDRHGNFVVAWAGPGAGGDLYGIYGQRFIARLIATGSSTGATPASRARRFQRQP
jgi:hypothetical protein